jgi:hypothetical protein
MGFNSGLKGLIQQLTAVTHRYTIVEQTEKTRPILNRPTLKHVMFLGKCKDKHFFLWAQHFGTTGVFITELSLTNCVGYDKLPFHE